MGHAVKFCSDVVLLDQIPKLLKTQIDGNKNPLVNGEL